MNEVLFPERGEDMSCCFTELRCKEVINVKSGCKLGFVDDVEIDVTQAQVCALVVFGRSRFFGLFGREDDIIIHWRDIQTIGEDTILVCFDEPRKTVRKRNMVFENLFK